MTHMQIPVSRMRATVIPVLICCRGVPVLRAPFVENTPSRANRYHRRLSAVLAAIAIVFVSAVPVSGIDVKDWRIVLPVCNCQEYVSVEEPVVVRLRWGAATRDLAETGADYVDYTLTVDGVEIRRLNDYRKHAVLDSNSGTGEDVWWVYWDYPLGTVSAGAHTVIAVIEWKATISDGWSTFPKGESATLKVTLLASEPSSLKPNYLSELQPRSVTVGSGAVSIGRYEFTSDSLTAGITRGDPIIVHGVEYPHGICAPAPSRLVYNLFGDFAELDVTIGLAGFSQCGDGVQFSVVVDDAEIYRSPPMVASTNPIDLRLNIAGGQSLVLLVNQRITADCDWAIWCDPVLK